jgi:receptor protein-tyrosine kinase
MSIIEQAAKRLEELRRAGVQLDPRPNPPQPTVPQRLGNADALARPTWQPPETRLPVITDTKVNSLKGGALPAAPNDDVAFDEPPRRSRHVDIDLVRLGQMGYLTPDAPRSQFADEYRVIKRPLLTNALRRSGAAAIERGNLILITSAMPAEGKTFTSINLALSMAVEVDCHVLLVDADVARPSVLDRLGLPPTKGLLDLLTNPSLDVGDVLLRTNVERFSILPAGTQHPRATEMLASEGMHRLVAQLASRYPDRILIFDAPPVLSSTESRVLAEHMGQIVMVVAADRTQRSAVTQALATLENCPVVMTLLNKANVAATGSYYGYYANAVP